MFMILGFDVTATLLRITLNMDTTIRRFESGVHDAGTCGANKNGFAAIDATFEHSDVHKLSSFNFQSSMRPLMHFRKRSFYSSDGLVYIFMKLMKTIPHICTYVFILSREMPLSSTFKSIVDSSALQGNIVAIVEDAKGSYSITIKFMDLTMTYEVDSSKSLIDFFKQSGLGHRIIIVGYPSFLDIHMSITNSIDTAMWCAPASRDLTYSSSSGTPYVHHFVYPWSKSPLCSGFTLGIGNIKYSADSERMIYVSSYNTYESMISSVPYKFSCTDCVELGQTAVDIKRLINKEHSPRRESHLKKSSIDALEELKAKILECVTGC